MVDSVISAERHERRIDSRCAPRDMRATFTEARMPAMPQVLSSLLDLCERDDADLGDLAILIGTDASLATRIFAVSASATYHGRTRVANLGQCLSLLGMDTVKTIVITESVMQVFNRFIAGRPGDLTEFWAHSLRSAIIARAIARKLAFPSPEEAYLGGLIHDVGRLAMLATDPDGYRDIFCGQPDDHLLCDVETDTFGLTHVEAGAWLVEKWALDSFLGDSVLYHHEPIQRLVSAAPLVRIVYAAAQLARIGETEASFSDFDELAQLGIVIEQPEEFMQRVETELAKLGEQLGIPVAAPQASAPAKQSDAGETHLASKLQDILLASTVLSGVREADAPGTALQGAIRALRIAFDLDAAICFECVDGTGGHYKAKLLRDGWPQLAQLKFVRGRSDSRISKSIDTGPAVIAHTTESSIFDEQIMRALGSRALLLLPLRRGRACIGVLVAPVEDSARAAVLQRRLPCLEYFARMVAEQLSASHKRMALPVERPVQDSRLNRLVHEVSNPLSIIRNYLALLESANADTASGSPELAIVREEIDRVGKMLRAVRESEETSMPAVGPTDVNRIAGSLAALLRGSVPQTIPLEIRMDLAEDLPEILSDRDKIKQLLVNLMKNAIEAMPRGGTLRVSTMPWGNGVEPSHVEIRIEDNGPGISKEILAHLYQPVTSRKGSEHQGLGLAVVSQLVHDLRGLINCRSDDGGTRFQLLLPLDSK